jgi:integrase
MKVNELKGDKTVTEWLTTINTRPNTERNYLLGFQWFTEWTGKEPEALLLEAEQEIKDGLLMRQRSIKKYLTGFRKHLQDRGNAPQTIKGYMVGVKSFYTAFDIEIPKLYGAGNKAQTLKKHKDIPTKEDIQEVLNVCDPLEKAVLLVGISSGLSAHEIFNLKVKDFKKGYDPETGITTLDLRRGKVNFDFITFLSPECSKAVQNYLAYRARKSKINETRRLNQLEKQRVFSDADHLFIKRYIDAEYLKTHDDELRKLDQNSFMKVYRKMSEKAQKNTPTGDWNLIRSHNMRKYFNSALLNAGADSFFVEYCMGHTLDDTRAAYFRASPEKLRDTYQKYIPYLTIQKDLDISESPEYQQIKKENQVLQAETARHIIERSELQDLRKEMQELKEIEKNLPALIQVLMSDPEAIEIMKNMKSQQKST